ncbi:GNAT family N-acetyltransferase [Flavobacterium sp. P4023]|uniref:GNAT family N-acetyltransferase n=1 Tax=Flavobacterium flabelliforme TaxID=2816119 RepID=A0ABS5CVU1_9FLAO|nr:GNAT family N-acetyltransferase [Flavobacterium flabelliforme]MBP4142737.1 GNAT family N-acetyltransferase [Flavobacterium flabelliforme]
MNSENNLEIIPFTIEEKDAIKTLNLEWLNKYFKVEPNDEIVLSNPKAEIIDKGGFIFYAKYKNQIIGTVSLLKVTNDCFELSKMAITEKIQGLGIGKKLIEYCLTYAKENNISKLILYSNRRLIPAIHLYKKYGFEEIELEHGIYERADIKMQKIIF